MSARVIPFPGCQAPEPAPPVSLVHGPGPLTRCPVCGERNDAETWHCSGCEVRMHGACYWGRVASMAEWLAFQRFIHDAPEDAFADGFSAPTVCPVCRARAGAAP